MCCELSVICLVASRKWIPYPLWNLILWTTSLPSRWPKVYSKISLHNVFSTNIVASRLILKMRSEDMLVEKLCIPLRFHSVTRQHFFKLEYAQLVSQAIKADHEEAEHLVCHSRLSTNHQCDEQFQKLVIFVCWLAPNYKSIVTYFWKTNSIAMVTTGACAVVTKKNNQNCFMYSFFKNYFIVFHFKAVF